MEGANHDELFGDDGGKSGEGGETHIKITSTHTIITNAGFTSGQTIQVTNNNEHLGFMNNNLAGVDELAHYDGKSNEHKLLAADAGVISGSAGKRVFYGVQFFDNLTANGVALFDSALEWAAAPPP